MSDGVEKRALEPQRGLSTQYERNHRSSRTLMVKRRFVESAMITSVSVVPSFVEILLLVVVKKTVLDRVYRLQYKANNTRV